MSKQSSTTLRVGIVPYLNMLPLIHGMEHLQVGGRGIEIYGVPPSQMTRMMDERALDIGMLPVGALIERRDWPIIGNSMIGCNGAVRSVIVAGRGRPEDWRIIHPDAQSRSSNALAQVLLRRYMGLSPKILEPIPMDDGWEPPAGGPEGEAFVLIGSRALRWRQHWEEAGGTVLDLGAEWKRHTGLPFVFAVWVARPDLDAKRAGVSEWMAEFERLKHENLARLEEIIAHWPGLAFERQTPSDAYFYLTENIRFDLDHHSRQGLDRFLSEAREMLARGELT